MQDTVIDTGRIIRDIRKIKGMTQLDLAKATDTSMRTIGKIEKNATNPSHSLVVEIIRALDISADHIFWPDRIFFTPEHEQLIRTIQAFNNEEQAVFMEIAWAYVRSIQTQKSAKK